MCTDQWIFTFVYSCVSPRILPAPQNVPARPFQAKLPASQVSTISDPFSSSSLNYILSAASMSCHFSFQGLSASYGKSPKIWTLILAPSLHLSGSLFLCQINCCFACSSDLFSTLPLLCSVPYWELHFPECFSPWLPCRLSQWEDRWVEDNLVGRGKKPGDSSASLLSDTARNWLCCFLPSFHYPIPCQAAPTI